RAPELLKWLDRRLLYNVPRSLLTEGFRPLGRLALVDNLADVQARLRDQLATLASPESRSATAAATGTLLRDDKPQVVLVASISGGAASGMLLDFGYAPRNLLVELALPQADVCAVLIHATGQRPVEAELARLNAYTTLSELRHYSCPSSGYPGDPSGPLNAWA